MFLNTFTFFSPVGIKVSNAKESGLCFHPPHTKTKGQIVSGINMFF
jgi:hypothetical protein